MRYEDMTVDQQLDYSSLLNAMHEMVDTYYEFDSYQHNRLGDAAMAKNAIVSFVISTSADFDLAPMDVVTDLETELMDRKRLADTDSPLEGLRTFIRHEIGMP